MPACSGHSAQSRASAATTPDGLRRTGETSTTSVVLARLQTRPALNAFVVAFVGTLAVALIQGPRPFYADAGGYWMLPATFTRDGHFSLLNFESPARGYVFALLLYVLRGFGKAAGWSPSSVVKLFNAATFALIGAVLAPRLAEITCPRRRWGFLPRIAAAALLVIFWSGELNYPLSDFPGLALALLTLIAIARPDGPGWLLLAGVAGAMAINVRGAYVLLLPMLALLAGLDWLRDYRRRRRILTRRTLGIGLLTLGFVAVSLPQALSMHRHYGTWIFVPGRPEGVAQEHYEAGMYEQRYDTVIDDGVARPGIYWDRTGLRILKEQPHGEIKSLREYADVILDHPIAMTMLLTRHLVNGLDMRYSTAYVEHIDSGGHLWLRLGGFLLVFLALARVLWSAARRSLGSCRWRYPIALVLCCVSSLPTEMQTRYLLPLWILCCMLVLTPAWPSPIDRRKVGLQRSRTLAILAVGYLAFMAIVWHIVSGVSIQVVT